MKNRVTVLHENDTVRVEHIRNNGISDPARYRVIFLVDDSFMTIQNSELFGFADALATVCNDIEDKREARNDPPGPTY